MRDDYICVACAVEYGVGYWTRGDAGPFCGECWNALNDSDQALLTEKRLAKAEAEIERLRELPNKSKAAEVGEEWKNAG